MNNVGPYRKRVKHFHQLGDMHELTFSCYHRLPLLTNDSWPLSTFVKSKLEVSKSTLLKKLTIRERPGKYSFRFWQEGPGFDRNLLSLKAIEASIDYIHRNPVERGLCARATDWKWSSARYYLTQPVKHQLENLPFIHGLRPEIFDREEHR